MIFKTCKMNGESITQCVWSLVISNSGFERGVDRKQLHFQNVFNCWNCHTTLWLW